MSPQPSWRTKYRSRASRGRYRNPGIYERTPKNQASRLPKIPRKFWVAAAALVLSGGLVWFLFFSQVFAIEEVKIVGAVTPEVDQKLQTLHGRNLLTYSATDLRQELATSQSSVRELEIFKGLPDTLRIDIALRDPVFVWERGEERYFVDKEGIVFQLNDEPAAQAAEVLVHVRDGQQQPVTLGQALVGSGFVTFVAELARTFPVKFPLEIDHLELGQTTFELTVVTKAGWRALLDTTRQLEPQLDALQQVFEKYHDRIKEYVDLRIPERAFFK